MSVIVKPGDTGELSIQGLEDIVSGVSVDLDPIEDGIANVVGAVDDILTVEASSQFYDDSDPVHVSPITMVAGTVYELNVPEGAVKLELVCGALIRFGKNGILDGSNTDRAFSLIPANTIHQIGVAGEEFIAVRQDAGEGSSRLGFRFLMA